MGNLFNCRGNVSVCPVLRLSFVKYRHERGKYCGHSSALTSCDHLGKLPAQYALGSKENNAEAGC